MAVEVFENLGILDTAVNAIESSAFSKIEDLAREALDVSLTSSQDPVKKGAPGRAMVPTPGSSGNLRTRLWDNLERLYQESIHNQCIQVIKIIIY